MIKSQFPLSDYLPFLNELKDQIRKAQLRAGLAANRELIYLYWNIGRSILERQKKEGWGAKIIDRLSDDLKKEFPNMRGFSARNLKYMRAFAEIWQDKAIVQQLVAQIPWGHNVKLIDMVSDRWEKEWYIQKTIENGWSRNAMNGVDQNICSSFYPRPEERGYYHKFSDKLFISPVVYGWDNDQTPCIQWDGVYAIFVNYNAMNGVYQNICSSFYPHPEGRGYERRFFDRTLNSPVVYGWDNDQSNRVNGIIVVE